jgi:hypothetical protein
MANLRVKPMPNLPLSYGDADRETEFPTAPSYGESGLETDPSAAPTYGDSHRETER